MILILTIIFLVFGLIIGSFLNVVILRFNTNKSLGGRSGCMSCHHELAWYELIPVFSFLFLLGRCKNCKTKISIQYPLVELAMGLVSALLFLKFKDLFFVDSVTFNLTYFYYLIVFSILIIITAYDFRHKIIPDSLSFALALLTFVGLFFFNGSNALGFYLHAPILTDFLSGLVVASPFAFFWLVSRGSWMGLGDAKLAIGLGWLLGLSGALSAFVLAFWTGAAVGLGLIFFSKKYGMKSQIPFAPYLILGTTVVFFFGLNLFAHF